MGDKRETRLVVKPGLLPKERVEAFEYGLAQELYNIMHSRRKSIGIQGAMAAEMAEELESGVQRICSEKGLRLLRHLGANFTTVAGMKQYLVSTEKTSGKLRTRIDTLCGELAHSLAKVDPSNKRYCVKQASFAYDELTSWPGEGVRMLGKVASIIVVVGCTKGSNYDSTWWSLVLGKHFRTLFTIFRVDLLVMGTYTELQDFWSTWHIGDMWLESDSQGNIEDRTNSVGGENSVDEREPEGMRGGRMRVRSHTELQAEL